jgi:hypothetical protein
VTPLTSRWTITRTTIPILSLKFIKNRETVRIHSANHSCYLVIPPNCSSDVTPITYMLRKRQLRAVLSSAVD